MATLELHWDDGAGHNWTMAIDEAASGTLELNGQLVRQFDASDIFALLVVDAQRQGDNAAAPS